jgi:predicted permease
VVKREARLKAGSPARLPAPHGKEAVLNLRVAFRSLRRSPGFTAVAILTLTLGIGAISAMFSVVNSVLLKPLAGFETERLVRLSETAVGTMARASLYREWGKLTDVFEEVGARQYRLPNLTGLGEPQQLRARAVTASWFGVFAHRALIGRTFLPEEDRRGNDQVVVLDFGFWTRRFGADAGAIGRSITLDQRPYTIIGVMPKDFLPDEQGTIDVHIPWVIEENKIVAVDVTARLRAGVAIDRARAALSVVQGRLAAAFPADYQDSLPVVTPLLETRVGFQRSLLRLLFAAAACVLLIACVNAANLFLARGTARWRETQIRGMLGGSRWHLLAPRLAESALISTFGGTLGLMAAWGITRIIATRVEHLARAQEVGVDARVVLVALAVAVLSAVACSAVPVFSRGRRRPGLLVVAEVALTFVLLVCSGLLIRSFVTMRQVDLGYQPSSVIIGFVSQPEDPLDRREAAIALWRRVRERIAALPGVVDVTTATGTPTGGMNFTLPIVHQNEDFERAHERPSANVVIVSDDYFRTVGIPLRAGRTFTTHDLAGPGVAIVSQSIADRDFAGHAVGKRIRIPQFGFNVASMGAITLRDIVGVVADVRQASLAEAGRLTLYLPETQNAARFTHVIVRAKAGDPMWLEPALRHVVYEEAPRLAVAPMLSLEQANAYLTRAPQQAMWLLAVFAALALLLAAVGVHGVVAYATTQRSREMGIRMALGARPVQLFRLVTRQALNLAFAGALVGTAGAYAASRLLESLLFGVGRTDPATYVAAIAILTAIAAIAGFTPALRAARTDPSITLRSE